MPAQKSKEETIRHQVLDAKCLKILSGAKVFCSVCNKSFTCNKTNHVSGHLEGKNHSEALLLKKPRQSILVPSGSQVEDNFNRKLVEEWLGAGLPLKVLSQPSFRSFFETAISRKIPSVSQLYTKYADTVYAEKQSTLLHLVKSFRSYYVMFDEADYNGEKYYAFLIGNLNAEGAHQPYLIELSREMKTPDAVAVQQKVIQLLSKVGKKYPTPVETRWGTWIDAVIHISENWEPFRSFLNSRNVQEDKDKAEKILSLMDQDGVKDQTGFLCSLRFIREKITESEAAGYTAIKAMNAVQFIQSRLLDLKETGNTIAEVALAKLDAVLEKNEGLRRVVRFANGESISEPADIGVFAFAPCTTVDVERFFSVLNAFVSDKPNILEQTLKKMLFIKYNSTL